MRRMRLAQNLSVLNPSTKWHRTRVQNSQRDMIAQVIVQGPIRKGAWTKKSRTELARCVCFEWVGGCYPKKLYPRFHYLGPHVMEQYNLLIKELYIVSVPQFNPNGSRQPILLASTESLVIYHCTVGRYIGHDNYVYDVFQPKTGCSLSFSGMQQKIFIDRRNSTNSK